jgi:1,6-anhydro-N-acetylmuramate kinase
MPDTVPDEVDAEFAAWLAEAYLVGQQRHLPDPGGRRRR